MNKLHWIFKQYLAPEGDDGASNGGAPAASAETDDAGGVDWASLSDGVEQGADEGGSSDDSGVDDENPPAAAFSTPPEENPDPDATTPDPAAKPPVTPVQEAPPAKTPEEVAAEQADLAKRFGEWQQSEIQRLTKDYAFNEDDAARLQTEPELVLPELAAKMQVNMTQQIVEIVQRMMPQMVQPELQRTNKEAQAETFFAQHNSDIDLKNDTHRTAVIEAGKAFRKMNPKATPEEAAKGIGQIVRVSLGLPAASAPPPTPKAKPGPHRPPVAGGKGSAGKAPPPTQNKWADLVDGDD